MCLAVPARLIECDAQGEALADLQGNRVRISTALVPDAQVGDWVLLHAGFALQKLDGEEARQSFSVLRDLQDATSDAKGGTKR